MMGKELTKMTGIKSGSKSFNEIIEAALKNRKSWNKGYSSNEFHKLLSDIKNNRRGTAHLLARMIYGEASYQSYKISDLRNEMLVFWHVVENRRRSNIGFFKDLKKLEVYCYKEDSFMDCLTEQD